MTPTGTVRFAGDGSGAFAPAPHCALAPTKSVGTASCSVNYTISAKHAVEKLSVVGQYGGNANFSNSSGTTKLTVSPLTPVVTLHGGTVTAGGNR